MKPFQKHIALIFCLLAVFCGRLNAAEDILPNISPEQKAMMEAALTSFGLLDDYQNYVDDLSKLMNMSNLENLPVGISRTMSNVEYTMAISGIVNKGDYADLTIYARIRTSRDTMFFGAQGIKFSYGGDFAGDVKLMLLADMTVPLWGGAELILHGGFDKESGRGVEKTYLTMGCEGIVFLTKKFFQQNVKKFLYVENNVYLCKVFSKETKTISDLKLVN